MASFAKGVPLSLVYYMIKSLILKWVCHLRHHLWDQNPAKCIAVIDRKIISINKTFKNTCKIITHKTEKQMHFFF